jgi:PhnB protein
MAIKSITPYLNFGGDAAQAVKLYESALGAKVERMMRFGDAPPHGGGEMSAADKERVMHASLRIDGQLIMLSDGPSHWQVPREGNVHVSLDFSDTAEMAKKFDALAEGGKVTMALQDTFWGARFGMLVDRFGIQWMFNCELKK